MLDLDDFQRAHFKFQLRITLNPEVNIDLRPKS